MAGSVVAVDSAETLGKIKDGEGVSVVDFTATWCGPCKAIAPHFERMASEAAFEGVTFAKVDIDEHPDIAADHNIQAVPTFCVFRNKKQVAEIQGADLNQLTADITAALKNPTPPSE